MLHFKRLGQGKPVIFLHGFLESTTMWENFDLENAPFESILIDLPGHGKSQLVDGLTSIVSVAETVIELMESLSLKDFDIVGHSLGGYVAIEIHKILKLKTKLILFHSNFWEDDTEKKANRNRVINVVKENKSFFIQEAIPNLFLEEFRKTKAVKGLIEEAKHISSDTIVLYSEMMRDRPDNTAYVFTQLNKLHIIQGKLDQLVKYDTMLSYKTDLQHFFLLEFSGHMSHFEQKKDSESLIFSLLDLN